MRLVVLFFLIAGQSLIALSLFEAELRAAGSDLVAEAVAMALRDGAFEDAPEYFAGLVEGMSKAESGEERPAQLPWEARLAWAEADYRSRGDQNASEVAEIFSNLRDQSGVVELDEGRLYYKTLEPGSGGRLSRAVERITAYVYVEPLNTTRDPAHISYDSFNVYPTQTYAMDELIPGVSAGVVDMCVGETREIYIHPALAYGDNSAFEPNVGLLVRVKLLEFDDWGEAASSPPSDGADQPVTGPEDPSSLLFAIGVVDGYMAWEHLRPGNDFYSLEEVTEALRQAPKCSAEAIRDIDLFSKLQCHLFVKEGV